MLQSFCQRFAVLIWVTRKSNWIPLWINILPTGGGAHTSHLHPHSVISGTTYVTMPEGASAIKFEDPRAWR